MSLRLRAKFSSLMVLSLVMTGAGVAYGQTPPASQTRHAVTPQKHAQPAKAKAVRHTQPPRKPTRGRPSQKNQRKTLNRAHAQPKKNPPKAQPKPNLSPVPPQNVQPVKAPPTAINSSQPVAGRLPSHWQVTVLDHPSSGPPIPLPPLPPLPGTSGAGVPTGSGMLPGVSGVGSMTDGSGQDIVPAVLKPSQDRILLPVSSQTGIAAYRSGMNFIVVFDSKNPLNTSALHGDGIFSTLTVTSLPDATILQMQLPDTRRMFLSRQAEGWVLGDKPPPGNYYSERNMITPKEVGGGLLYPMRRPGRVLSINDPISHQRLLVGTTQLDDGGILDSRKGSGYDVWASVEGVVFPVYSPEVGLRATASGPLLFANGGPIADLFKGVYANKVDQQWLGLQKLPLVGLQKRYYDAFMAAVDSDPGQRFSKRLEEAKAAFSEGSFIEARGILTIALEDDPEEGLRPDVGFLLSASELMTGRLKEASMLDSPWPEDAQRATQVWRALYLMREGGHEGESAHMLAQDFERLRNYPLPVRQVIEPEAAEQIARYGKEGDFTVLSNLPAGDAYQLAQAFIDLRMGHRRSALQTFATLAGSRDPIVAEKAYEQKTLLDMSDKTLTPLTAANKFASLIPDARLAGREMTVRLLQANAYMRAQKWGEALTSLDLAQESPEHSSEPMLGVMLFQTLAQIAHGAGDKGTRDDAIRNAAMLRGHLSTIPQGKMKGEILVAYGRMLLDLGLFNEARMAFSDALPMLEGSKEMHVLADVGLANTYLAEGNLPQANAVLNETDTSGMPQQMRDVKRRMQARIDYKAGDPAQALSLLKNDMVDDSLDFRARIHEGRGEWQRAVAIVRRMVETTIPPQGSLDSSKQLLALRLASDASSANDRATLLWLAQLVGQRETEGESGRVFQLLTHNAQAGESVPGNTGIQ